MSEHANLVSGRWASSAAGGRFEVRAAAEPAESLGSWPTSGPPDVELALNACSAELSSWAGLPASERERRLLEAAEVLERDGEAARQAAQGIGLTAEEMRPHLHGLRRRLRSELTRAAAWAERGTTLCAPSWSDLFEGALLRCARELLAGRACVLVSDPRLPVVADGLARALLAAGIEGPVAVLHGLTLEGCSAAVRDERVTRVVATAWRDRIAWWREACTAGGVVSQALDVPRAAAVEVDVQADLEPQAIRIVRDAFDRSSTLFGQRRGQVARVHCQENAFSRFSEVFLAVLEESVPALDPLPLVDREMEREVRRQWAVGLDDGATLIFGGEGFEGRDDRRRVLPTVFTNVEPRMACARRQEPIPVLSLLRAHS